MINTQLPWDKWNKSIFTLNRKSIDIDILKSTFTYEEARKGFKNDYHNDNPINYTSNEIHSTDSLCKHLKNYLSEFPQQNDIFSRNKKVFPVNYGYGLAYHSKNCQLPYGVTLLAPFIQDEETVNKVYDSSSIIHSSSFKEPEQNLKKDLMEYNVRIDFYKDQPLSSQNMKLSSSSQMIKTLTIEDKEIDKNNLNYLLSIDNNPKNIYFSSNVQGNTIEFDSLSPIQLGNK